MSTFYITLPSNSSMEYFPNNTLSNYVTKLPQPFDLKGEWEVGLSEIQFPITWYNLNENESRLHVTMYDDTQQFIQAFVSPPIGHYEHPNVLIKQINEAIAKIELFTRAIRFSYNEISRKITITFDKKTIAMASLKMSKGLADLLGFEYSKFDNIVKPIKEKSSTSMQSRSDLANNVVETLFELPDGQVELIPFNSYSYTGSKVCDLQRGFNSLYVYCDIVEPTVVGDVKVPLLRCVNISGKHEETVDRIYKTVHYVPLHRKQFDSIDINIRDDTGRSVPFQRGKVIVTLHFRMKKPPYF